MSEVRVASNGHCYIELVEKGNRSTPIAKARAIVWSDVFPMLKFSFEEATGQRFTSGLKVQLEVRISFSEVYGYSLIVTDIDPVYTMGSLAQLRREIVERLTKDGTVDMNKMLMLPRPLKRIAVISSSTAAGFGDFCNQLDNNTSGYAFHYELFPAYMQGERTAESIIGALDAVACQVERWDAVVIIRGGGAVSDLACFEDYDLASCCAQFPLPVITGIGHERDTTVLDLVANMALKTPTAVAAFLIERMEEEANMLHDVESVLNDYAAAVLYDAKQRLADIISRINHRALNVSNISVAQLMLKYQKLCDRMVYAINTEKSKILIADDFNNKAQRMLRNEVRRLEAIEKTISLYDPMKLLKLGYSITRLNGKVLTNPQGLKTGDCITTTLAMGTIDSKIM